MDEFTFPNAVPGGQCRLRAFPKHQLGLGSPPPWLVAVADDDGAPCGERGEEEKMDMLWEDFNEELTRTPPVCPLSPLYKGELMMMKEAWLDDDGVGLIVATTEKRGRNPNAGSVVRRRRWSLLLMLRLLKKLFLVKNSRNQRTAPIYSDGLAPPTMKKLIVDELYVKDMP